MDAGLLMIVAVGADAGDADPQHRPVGRLGDRPRRLRLGRPAAQPSRARRARGGILAACGVGLACGLLNGLVVTVGRVPVDRRHARHAHGLSRPHQPLGRRQAGQRRPGAAGLARHDQRQRRRHPGRGADRAGHARWSSPSCCARLPVGRELYAIGSNPDGAAADRHPRRGGACSAPSPAPACSPASTAPCGPRATPPSTPGWRSASS